MKIFWRMNRTIWRWLLALVLSITVSAALVLGTGSITARSAAAASTSDRGPSAAVDEFNNQYVFWKGEDSNLWEAYYNSYAGRWYGPLKVGMGPLGSEPSVTVTTQVFAGPGGNAFNAQYVYWRGTNGYIWMAYWNGSWHGPIQLTYLGSPESPVCSQPSAVFVEPPAGSRIYIFWKGIGTNGTCGSDAESTHLWYAFSTSWPAYSYADYSGPNLDCCSGPLGSSPSVTSVTTSCVSGNDTCQDEIAEAWQGEDGHLWEEVWNVVLNVVTGPMSDTAALGLGSPPSIAAPPLLANSTDNWDAFWQGSDSTHRLWFVTQYPNEVGFSPLEFSGSGPLGSAPTVAEATVGIQLVGDVDIHVFWKGLDAKLWEAYYSAHTGSWSLIGLAAYSGNLG